MVKPVTKVLPTFKLKEGGGEPQIIAKKYLHAVELGRPTRMVSGGDYYLDEKGKPRYPKDNAKSKPILIGQYFFHLSDKPLKKDDLAGLTRGDCFDRVTLENKPNQEILLKRPTPDHIFIMGTDKKGKFFYESAEDYFRWGMHFPADWVHLPQDVGIVVEGKITFKELLDQIANLKKPFRYVYVVSHASKFGSLPFPLDYTDPTKKLAGHLDKSSTNWYNLMEAKDNGEFTEATKKLAGHLTKDNAIRIRGCDIGQNTDTLNVLASIFGGKSKVSGPTHKQNFASRSKTIGKGKNKKFVSHKAWQYYVNYWVRFPGKVRKGRKALMKAFEERYDNATPKPGNWRKNIRKARRRVIYLPAEAMNYYQTPTHPPSPPDEKDKKKMNAWRKKVLKFAKKHWAKDFKEENFKPTSFVNRGGPKDVTIEGKKVKAYVYTFEEKKKVKGEEQVGTITIDVPTYPAEEEIVKKEKTRHPHPEWYRWKVIQKKLKKGSQTRFRAQAVMTMYEIRVALREASTQKGKKGKLIETEEPNATYYGQSK